MANNFTFLQINLNLLQLIVRFFNEGYSNMVLKVMFAAVIYDNQLLVSQLLLFETVVEDGEFSV